MAQLRQLAKLLPESNGAVSDTGLLASLAAETFSSPALRPVDGQLIYDRSPFQVWRSERPQSDPAYTGPEGLRQALRQMVEPVGQRATMNLSFHIVEVSQSESLATRVHVEFTGRSDARMVEQDAHWRVTWQQAANQAAPRISAIEVEDFLETRLDRGQPWFQDATQSVFAEEEIFRRQLAYSNTHWRKRIERHHIIDKSGHHGLAIGDVNGDGLDDIYVCQPGGLPNRLLIQQPNGTVTDRSVESGTAFLDNTRSALIIDFDNNSTQDLILATVSGLVFMANNGDGRFRVTNNITAIIDAYSMAAADYDQDGDLDIYACRYYQADADPLSLPIPTPYFDAQNGGKNYLIRNDGNWRTSNATAASGLDENNNRFSYAAIWIDYDRDGDQDLYVVNDFGRNNLYRNNQLRGSQSKFTDVAMEIGMDSGAFGMSASSGDYDRDGWEDLYVGNMFSSAGSRISRMPDFKPGLSEDRVARYQHLARGNTLFKNLAGDQFQDVSVATGVTMGRWSWGSLFADLDNDGWQDLIVANGYITGDKAQDDL